MPGQPPGLGRSTGPFNDIQRYQISVSGRQSLPQSYRSAVTVADGTNLHQVNPPTALNTGRINPESNTLALAITGSQGTATSITLRVYYLDRTSGAWLISAQTIVITLAATPIQNTAPIAGTVVTLDTLGAIPLSIALEVVTGGALGAAGLNMDIWDV